jgi:thermitase
LKNRLPLVLFATALALMAAALSWLLVEMYRTPASADLDEPAPPPAMAATVKPAPVPPQHLVGATDPSPHAAPDMQPLNVPDAIPGEALLTFRTAAALAAFRDRAGAQGLEVLGYDDRLRTARVRIGDPRGLERDLNEHGEDYSNIGPNLLVRVPGLPPPAETDLANQGGREPFESQGLDRIGAAADRTGWGERVKVAVIDSGVADHPSLRNADITHIDLVSDGSVMNGHGTAMASLIAGNDPRVGGVAPAAKLIDIRVTDTNGESNTALLSSAIVKATDLGARVINISLGSSASTPMLEDAVRYAQSRNVVIVAAAGNEQQTALSMPAGLPGVLSVGAVDAGGKQAWFSNSGAGLTLAAPGVGIVSGYADNKVVIGSGTSQATAITSGAVAYLLGRGYHATNIIPLLSRTAAPLSAPAEAVGAGLLQLPK